MEQDRINLLLNNPAAAAPDDIAIIENEIIKYPYSQMLRILLAKVEFQLQLADRQKKLSTAAIYSSDRSILKKVITSDEYLNEIVPVIPLQDISGQVSEEGLINEGTAEDQDEDESSPIFDEVLQNLEKLKSLREQFHQLELTVDLTSSRKSDDSEESLEEEKKYDEESTEESDTATRSEEKKKMQDEILEKDEEIDSEVNAYFLTEIEKKQPSSEQVAANRHEVQKEIIERFIKDQPSIRPVNHDSDNKSTEEVNKDLSEKSTRFGDDLVSENLAIILLKQGKKERAIDIYKKLIWKLPQKKAYFAARIEEIKN